MHPIFKDYLDCLTALHNDIKQAIEGLPSDALDWVPTAEMNSINVLVMHLTGAARYLISDLVIGTPSGRDRPAEFQARGLSSVELHYGVMDMAGNVQEWVDDWHVEDYYSYCEPGAIDCYMGFRCASSPQ